MKFNAGEYPKLQVDGSEYSYRYGLLRKYAFQVFRDGSPYSKSKPETPLCPNWNHLFVEEENKGKWRKVAAIHPRIELQIGKNSFDLSSDPDYTETKSARYLITSDGMQLSSLMIEYPKKMLDSSTRIELTEHIIEPASALERVILRGLIYYLGFHFIPSD